MSDSPPTPADETAPTSGSEILIPTPEIEAEIAIVSPAEPTTAPVSAPETAPAPESVEIETTQPQITFETQSAPEIATPIAPEIAAPIAPEIAAPIADDPALALTFTPAPDAPFQSSVTVGISSHVADARIYYTLDGTAPDENATPYSPEKILLTQSATLSARAFLGDKSGPICSADYIVSKPLWQENEPADQTDIVAHMASDNQTSPDGWQMSAASVRGKLHAHRALWREDSFALGSVENSAGSWSFCIVSDGAGSAPLSRVGSNVACQSAAGDLAGSLGDIEALSDDINADLPRVKAALVDAAVAALGAIRDEADKRSQPVSAFAATLLILVRRSVGAAQLCAAIQVGDGAIALDCASGLKLLGAADHGQHSSETRFLTTSGMEDDFANRVKFSLPKDLRATLVVSDGVSDDYFPEDKRLIEVFEAVAPLAKNADDAGAALLEWLGYEKKGSSDDRTLVLSWPLESGAVAALEAELGAAGLAPSSKQDFDFSPSLEESASSAPETRAPDAATSPAQVASTELTDGT